MEKGNYLSHSFFDILTEEIAELGDVDLHELVANLSRTELSEARLDPTHVHSGGHQDAPDGGVDIKIEIPKGDKPRSRFLQRSHIVIQVKKSAMPPAKIKNEMQPKGNLRPVIKETVEKAGAYIIVSSESIVAEKIREREETMRRAVAKADPEGRAQLNFIDGSCLADWARQYPGIVLWVKSRIGRPQNGWRPYETWAHVPKGGKNDYIEDEKARLFDDRKPGEEGIPLIEGLHIIRRELNRPGSVIRLIGLSGVGKTRFVQALFEDSIGEASLNPALAVYTDAALEQSPTPTGLLEQLAAQRRRAVVILDNCRPELHAAADKICRRANSQISMISVEYDVRDDIAPESGVFRLDVSDTDLIEQLVRQHHPHISRADARKVAKFSGGNARMADALADTIKDGQKITGLRNEELFCRLFFQRHENNDNLLRCAEALSLVYSYDVEENGADSELKIIGEITGKTVMELYEASAELQKRGLVQERSRWRAVLPHAIANRLAENALEKVPRSFFYEPVKQWRTERLVRSFSHRLKYLQNCEEAASIVDAWLAPEGWLGMQVANSDLLDPSVLENIVLVSPEIVLSAVERTAAADGTGLFTSRSNRHYQLFVRLLRIAAHETQYFDRCMELLIRFALSEHPEENNNRIRPAVCGMYHISHSGTWAPDSERLTHIKRLIQSDDEKRRVLGADFLRAALDMDRRWVTDSINLGSWSRDSGYAPKSQDDFVNWHSAFINLVIEFSSTGGRQALLVKKVLASNFRRLWSYPQIRSHLEAALEAIQKSGFWPEGWRAVRETLFFDSKKKSDKASDPEPERLKALDKILRPIELIDRARAYAFAERHYYGTGSIEPEYTYQSEDGGSGADNYHRVEQMTESVACEVAKDASVLSSILPDLFISGGGAVWRFGRGLAEGADDLAEMWRILKEAASQITPNEIDARALKGFIHSANASDPQFVSQLLDELVADASLGPRFPDFQVTVEIGADGYRRLLQSLDLGMVPTPHYHILGWGRAHESLNDGQLSEIVSRILDRADGFDAAVEIVSMRFLRTKEDQYSPDASITGVAQKLLKLAPVKNTPGGMDGHNLSNIAEYALRFDGGESVAQTLCARFQEESELRYIPMSSYQELFLKVAKTHPNVLLDNFTGNPSWRGSFGHWDDEEDSPILSIPTPAVLAWCSHDPDERCAAIAHEVRLYKNGTDGQDYVWRSIFWELFEIAAGKKKFLEAVSASIVPSSGSGNLSVHIENRMCLFEELLNHSSPDLKEWAEEELQRLKEYAAVERKHEEERKSREHESFE